MVNADASGKGNSVFARSLAHTELAVREKAFARLAAFLAARAAADGKALERLDLLKIWKGLFYAFWHSDLAPIQAELAERIARLLMGFQSPKDSELYFATFLETMRREWYGIDKLRMDKFMMLVRKFTTRTLQYLDSLQWDEEAVEGFMEALATCGLEDQLTSGIGFALHLTDVWAPALAAKEVSGCSAETLSVLLEPFVHCMAFHSNATVLTRVQQEVLPGGLPELVESPHVGAAKVHEVRQLLAERIRERAEDPEAVRAPKNRKALYEVAKALDKAVKKTLKRGLPDSDTPSTSTSSASTASASASAARSTAAAPSDDAEEHVTEPPKKKKKKAKAAVVEAAEAVPADVSGLAMPSADEWSDGALAGDWAAAPMDTEDSPATPKSEKKKKKKKKDKESPSRAAAEEPHTPSRASLKASSAGEEADEFHTPVPAAAKKRKSVRISLKHNLEFPHKSKPLSPSVRTPLASRPKGPALKAVSKWPSPPQSAPAKPSRSMLGAERSPKAPATEHKKKKKKKSKEGREDGPGHTPGAKKYSGGFTPRSPTSPSPSPPSRRSAESFF